MLLSTSGCVTLPEPGTELRDYEFEAQEVGQSLPLAGPEFTLEEILRDGQPVELACTADFVALDQYTASCAANTQALDATIEAYDARTQEALRLLMAGQAAEQQAEIYHAVASGHSATVQALMWPATGVGALMLLLIAL